jgi:hypothetical protein
LIRIKIIRTPPIASVDGVQLDCFKPGEQYEVGNSLGSLFLAEGWAEPVPLDEPYPVLPFSSADPYDSRKLYADPPKISRAPRDKHGSALDEREMAADMMRWRRRKRRR